MRIAVIGAGIVGVTSAFELAADGHAVTVFERRSSVAEENSFANAGIVAPGGVSPLGELGDQGSPRRRAMRQLFARHAPITLVRPLAPSQWRWMWRWWRAGAAPNWQSNRARMHRLAHYSHGRLRTLADALQLDHEQASGHLVLLRSERDLDHARSGLALLAELGLRHELVDAARARDIEPGLNTATPLHAALHLPDDLVGNCRQFAHLLRAQAQQLGAQFRFQRQVSAIAGGARAGVQHSALDGSDTQAHDFDAVVVCAALGATALLRPLGLRLPLAAVHGYSITAPLHLHDGQADNGPRAAVMDERFKVAISRLGQRLRVSGSAEVGGRLDLHQQRPITLLYKVLEDWFPGSAQLGKVQVWKGARPTLPDGPPVLGRSGVGGVWLNLGHGANGWALACGSARLLADQISGRATAIDPEGLGVDRLHADPLHGRAA